MESNKIPEESKEEIVDNKDIKIEVPEEFIYDTDILKINSKASYTSQGANDDQIKPSEFKNSDKIIAKVDPSIKN